MKANPNYTPALSRRARIVLAVLAGAALVALTLLDQNWRLEIISSLLSN